MPSNRCLLLKEAALLQSFFDIYKVVDRLINQGVVSVCCPSEGEFISSFFLVKESNGDKRFILNVKRLNHSISCPYFKIEYIRLALKLIEPGSFMCTVDLKNAYFLVSILNSNRKYLSFIFNKQFFEFICLSFGLSSASFTFIKFTKPIVQFLRA